MVAISFILILVLLGFSATMARGIEDILNLDSIAINIIVIIIYLIAIKGWKMMGTVLKMSIFNCSNFDKRELIIIIPQLKGLIYVNIIGGLLSTIQGIYSGIALSLDSLPIVIYYASITTFYALILSFFVFYPILIRLNNELAIIENS